MQQCLRYPLMRLQLNCEACIDSDVLDAQRYFEGKCSFASFWRRRAWWFTNNLQLSKRTGRTDDSSQLKCWKLGYPSYLAVCQIGQRGQKHPLVERWKHHKHLTIAGRRWSAWPRGEWWKLSVGEVMPAYAVSASGQVRRCRAFRFSLGINLAAQKTDASNCQNSVLHFIPVEKGNVYVQSCLSLPMVRSKTAHIPDVSLQTDQQRQHVTAVLLQHHDFLRNLARKLAGGDSEDLLQDVAEKVLRHRHLLPPPGHERPWLARVLHNQFIDRLRRAKARKAGQTVELTDDVASEASESAITHEEHTWWQQLTAEQVRSRVTALPMDLRTTFELFTYDGKTYVEIADALKISKITVGTRILRARQRLRQLLHDTAVTEKPHDGE
jgi:RNA polymerase sigma-70 factor, ECF subfamily